MKKVIFISVISAVALLISLAISTDIKNPSGSIDLNKALQTADARDLFVLGYSSTATWNIGYSGLYYGGTWHHSIHHCLNGGARYCTSTIYTWDGYQLTPGIPDPEIGETGGRMLVYTGLD